MAAMGPLFILRRAGIVGMGDCSGIAVQE